MKNLRVYSESMIPSKNIIPEIMKVQYKFRQTGVCKLDKNEVGLALLEEPIWWNRPVKSDVFIKQEPDGIYSLNFPFYTGKDDFKSQYNSLLNEGCIPIAIQLRLADFEKPVDTYKLAQMPVKVVKQTLIELGVDPTHLESVHNDLLYQGRKFMGVENICKNGWYSINFMVTLFYKPEESIFKRLTGDHAFKRPITGIIEETNLFTREEFVEAIMKNFYEFLKDM